MLDRHLVRQNPEIVRRGIARKGMVAPIDEFLRLDEKKRVLQTELDAKRAESNRVSKSIGLLVAQGRKDEADAAKEAAKALKEEIAQGEEKERELEAELSALEYCFPNLPHATVPDGFADKDNVQISSWGDRPTFGFEPKPHWELAESLGIIDFAAGAKISGSGFIVYRGLGARLQRALFNYMVEFHTGDGRYIEIYPPYVVNRTTLTGTGQLPRFEDDLYHMERDDLFLIPTAEVPVTNLHRDEILEVEQLPIYYAAFSGCFRREAGAAGKDTRGLLRVHEFDKVELVKLCTPETSYHELETMREDAERVLQSLGLHYRVMLLCAGELGFANAKCYDLEVFAPGVDRYLEVSSASNFEDFQARRANIRFRPERGAKPLYVHTLNASGVALPRLTAAILETYQREDGKVTVPEVLRSRMGTDVIG